MWARGARGIGDASRLQSSGYVLHGPGLSTGLLPVERRARQSQPVAGAHGFHDHARGDADALCAEIYSVEARLRVGVLVQLTFRA